MAQTSRHTGPMTDKGETFAEFICKNYEPIFNTGIYQAQEMNGKFILFSYGIWLDSHGKSWGFVESFETLSDLVNAIARVKAPTA